MYLLLNTEVAGYSDYSILSWETVSALPVTLMKLNVGHFSLTKASVDFC